MGRRLAHRVGILCCILFAAAGYARAQELIEQQVDPRSHGIDTARDRSEAARFRYVRLNPLVLAGSAFSIDLFPGLSVKAVGRKQGRQLTAETWAGEIEGEPFSSVIMAVDDSGALFGKVEFGGHTFIIRHKAGPVHTVLEVSGAQVDEGFEDGVPLHDTQPGAVLGKGAAASACLPSSTCSGKTIDVMVVYTSAARSSLGGTAAAEAAISAAVAEINTANANSGVTHTFNLVYTDEVWYVESGNASTDLSRLSGSFDGYMDQIHTWRDQYGADLVSLITDTGGCGIGYIQSDPTLLSSSAAFSVVRDDCMTTNRSLAHEMGHNMGLHHDWYVNSNVTPCLWHHGYVNQEAFGGTAAQRWRTIMAYNNQCADQGGFNCSRYRYWSNPLVLKEGDPMGTPQGQSNPSDAAFALNRTACQVAEFRASTSTPDPPMYPTGLVATGASESMISVVWNDNATDETGYKIQRSQNGTSGWADIATLAADVESFADNGLPGGAEYYYRAYAFHSTGQSEFSNVDSARTMIVYTDHVAQVENVRYGSSSTDLSNTYANDGTADVLQEEETDGWLQNRTSRLDATWEFDVPSGVPLTLHANAWSPPSSDGDHFLLSYSFDGESFSPMFQLSETSDTNVDQSYELGVSTGPTVWIRILDTDRNRGSRTVDYVYVDHLFVREQASGDTTPPSPEHASICLSDLRISTTGNKRWTSTVQALVHLSGDHVPVAGVTVSGVWSDGDETQCMTDEAGTCDVSKDWKPKVGSASFSVKSLSKEDLPYDPSLNEVPASITVAAPHALSKEASEGELPGQLTLRQNYPNPFNPSTVLEYAIPESGHVTVSIFNALGIEVRRLQDGLVDSGWHRATFDASGLSSGVYFAIIQSSGATVSRTMLLMK